MKISRISLFIVFLLVNISLVFSLTGLDNPPGELVEDAVIFTVSPTTFTLSSTQIEIQITLTAKDPYVYKDAYFCKAPCRQLSDWILLGEFTDTPKGGNYFDGKGNGISNQFTISKANLNSGNNFVAVYTCKGYNNCNTKKCVKQSFIVSLVACNVNSDCAAGVCNPANNLCVQCLADSNCASTPSTPKCDLTSKTCKDKCFGVSCTTGVCDTNSGSCVGCLSNADCASGLTCTNNVCVSPSISRTVTSGTGNYAKIVSDVSVGASAVSVDGVGGIVANDEVLVHQTRCSTETCVGTYEFV